MCEVFCFDLCVETANVKAFVRIWVSNKVLTVFNETIKQSKSVPLLPRKVSASLELVVMVPELPHLSCFLMFYSMPHLASVISVILKTQCHVNVAYMFTLVRLNKILMWCFQIRKRKFMHYHNDHIISKTKYGLILQLRFLFYFLFLFCRHTYQIQNELERHKVH